MASDAEEVAEDYRHALEDLSSNMRFEISNLTVIARENTEHALAIAEVLQQHILKAPPNKKLPSLYVLDSIVKNVGTPYTLYFGRNLFKTFMESYAVVDHNIRRKMEEMLRTWKDPVPGSMDTRPVFSHELVRPIENALMKARAASMPQQGPVPGRPRSAMLPHRDTPTPPGMRGASGPAGAYPGQPFPQPNGGRPGEPAPGGFAYPGQQQYPHHPTPQPGVSTPAAFQPSLTGPYGPAAPAGISVETLSNDIQNLIVAMRAEFSHNPHDASVQNRLRALLDLQAVVQRTSLPPDQLELIKNKAFAAPPHTTSAALTLDSLLGPGALAALMHATRSPPPTQAGRPQPPSQNAVGLLDRLRQAGMLPPATRASAGAGSAAAHSPAPPPTSMLPPNIASLLSSSKLQAGQPGIEAPAAYPGLDAASLKQQFHPEAVAALYEDLGPPCTQCGRRFKTDAEGKKKKMAHMDWHFRVHQRSTEAERRGTHRSWYVDQQDWLRSREVVDSDHVAAPEEASKQAAEADKVPQYIPVPDPSSGVNNVCPICQEKFENKWLDTAQEWLWLDAVLVGNRAYHASCHAEATMDRESTPIVSRRTPEPILGKRKAETSLSSPKIRTMKTSA
ncbi:mRNA cleavage factor complex component Pcf11 [Hirsutella rhossiliensis]|uniref:mRNA cleavage factor complex component Pcf11 n=1 Tax=Hirsutella rhossiliensis TaxID=111463 RepID=A0A9P8N9K7_9HYPO|nr:mRNA cleavage factor complex component Pcf11 [Hirsutella rhossiliensis]KAH0968249.1 mRNA cleavage factor complex component Pcf11 [Hirsutella rhossiliensis]